MCNRIAIDALQWMTPPPSTGVVPDRCAIIFETLPLNQTVLVGNNSIPCTFTRLLPTFNDVIFEYERDLRRPYEISFSQPISMQTLRITVRFFAGDQEITDNTGTNPNLTKLTPSDPMTMGISFDTV